MHLMVSIAIRIDVALCWLASLFVIAYHPPIPSLLRRTMIHGDGGVNYCRRPCVMGRSYSHSMTSFLSVKQQRLVNSVEGENDSAADEAADSAPHSPSTANEDVCFHIREATYSDMPQVANLIADGFFHDESQKNPLMRLIRPIVELDRLQGAFPYDMDSGGRHYYLVAYDTHDNNRVVGFCDVDGRDVAKTRSCLLSWSIRDEFIRRPQPYISDLIVSSSSRRRGLASLLLDEAERLAEDMKFEEMYICVRHTNKVALRMYSERGYEVVQPVDEAMQAFLEVQEDLVMLQRSLRSTALR